LSILKRFNDNLIENPNKRVIISDTVSFTFYEIDKYSDYISNYIKSNSSKGIIPMYINSTVYIMPTILGILKSKKIPFPLTTDLGIERSIERMSEVDFDLIITDNNLCEQQTFANNIKFFIPLSKDDLEAVFVNNDKNIHAIIGKVCEVRYVDEK
jgi:acyl-coenzyme A synthetase/AMP-(fatty) acid ligase